MVAYLSKFKCIFDNLEWGRSDHTLHWAMLIPALIITLEAKTVLEIGIARGWTTQVIAQTLHWMFPNEGLLISCDINPECCKESNNVAIGLNLTHKIMNGDSSILDWRSVINQCGREFIDIALIDGGHEYECVKKDIKNSIDILKPNGVLVVHDHRNLDYPGVTQAVNELIADGWQYVFLPNVPEGWVCMTAILQKFN